MARFPWWFLWPSHDELMEVGAPRQNGRGPLASTPEIHVDAGLTRLRVHRVERGLWWWQIVHPDGTGQGKAAASHAEALAVGLAALEADSLAGSRP